MPESSWLVGLEMRASFFSAIPPPVSFITRGGIPVINEWHPSQNPQFSVPELVKRKSKSQQGCQMNQTEKGLHEIIHREIE